MNKIFSYPLFALALGLCTALLPPTATAATTNNQATTTTAPASNEAYTSRLETILPLLKSGIMMSSLTKSLSTDSAKRDLIGSKLSATLEDGDFQKAFVAQIAMALQKRNTDTSYKGVLKAAGKEWPKALFHLFNGGISRLNDNELQKLFGAVSNTVNRWDNESCSLVVAGKSDSKLRKKLIDQLDINDVRSILDVSLQAMKYEAKRQPAANTMTATDLKQANSALVKVVAKWALEDPVTATQTLNLIKNASTGGEADPATVCKASRQLLNKANEVSGTEGALLRRLIVHTYLTQLQLK